MKKRKIAWGLTCLMLMMGMAACSTGNDAGSAVSGPSEGGKSTAEASGSTEPEEGKAEEGETEIRVVWWGSDSRHEATLETIDLFEEKFPEIKVVPEYMGGDSYWDKLATQVAGGNAPDVQQFGGNYPDYVSKNALLPLNDYFGNLIDIEEMDQGVIDSATMDGKTYGLCLGTNMLGIVYNQTMIENAGAELPKPGASWEDLTAYNRALAEKLPEAVFPMADNSGNNTNYIGYFARQEAAPMYRDGETKMTPTVFSDFFQMWKDWRESGVIPDAETAAEYSEEGADTSSLVAGKVAMSVIYSNQLVGYQEAMEDELSIMPLPDMEKNAAWVMPSQYFCLNNASEKAKQDAGAVFINYFVNDPEVGKILGNDRGIPASGTVREAIAADATPVDKKIYALYDIAEDHTSPMDPNVPNDQEYTDGFKRICQEVAFETKTVEEAAQEAYDLLLEMIEKQ